MKTRLLFFLLFFSSFLSFSQHIEGVVLDADTQKPIEGVHVFMKGINKGTLTDSKGVYYLKFSFKKTTSDTIIFSHLTYKRQRVLFKSKKHNYPVYLRKNITVLNEIRIRGKRNLKKEIRFKRLAPLKNAMYSFGASLNNGVIYVVGGNASYKIENHKRILHDSDGAFLEILRYKPRDYRRDFYKGTLFTYNIKNNIWKEDTLKFRKRAFHKVHLYRNQLYILGGKNLSKNKRHEYLDTTIEVLDLEKRTISTDYTNPHQAVNFTSVSYENFIFFFGGSLKVKGNMSKVYSKKVHLFNIVTGFWYELENMPKAKEVKGVLVNNIVYFIGGYNKKPLSEIVTYNLKTKKWHNEGDFFYGISSPSITHYKHMIYIYDEGKIMTYNSKTKKLSEYFINIDVKSAELIYANEKIYIIGGVRENYYSSRPSETLFSIDINEFEKTKVRRSKTF